MSTTTKKLCRAGLATKGLLYSIIGVLTAMAAFNEGGKKTGSTGALKWLQEQPFGRIILGIVAIGLLGYVLYRYYTSVKDIENKGDDAKGMIARTGYGVSGLLYLSLAVTAATMAIKGTSGGGGGSSSMISDILAKSWGPWLIGFVAVCLIGFGLYQMYQAFSKKFKSDVFIEDLKYEIRRNLERLGRAGIFSRGIVVGIVGFLFMRAALSENAGQAGSKVKAFEFLKENFGSVVMGIIALGLLAYGIWMFCQARYKRLNIS
ncbi:MAG: DUF1206 domain-containing protein [Leeuwenhoekiella sp.]